MTPPQFTIQDGYLKELPRMEKPDPRSYAYAPFYTLAVKMYNEHIASLRSYRLANPSDWEGVKMPIGEDQFKIEERWLYSGVYDEIKGHNTMGWVKVAIPTQPAKGQEERTFTLEEMVETFKQGFKTGWKEGYAEGENSDEADYSHTEPGLDEYFKTKFNITLTPKPQ